MMIFELMIFDLCITYGSQKKLVSIRGAHRKSYLNTKCQESHFRLILQWKYTVIEYSVRKEMQKADSLFTFYFYKTNEPLKNKILFYETYSSGTLWRLPDSITQSAMSVSPLKPSFIVLEYIGTFSYHKLNFISLRMSKQRSTRRSSSLTSHQSAKRASDTTEDTQHRS